MVMIGLLFPEIIPLTPLEVGNVPLFSGGPQGGEFSSQKNDHIFFCYKKSATFAPNIS